MYGPSGQPTQDSVSPAYLLAHPSQCPVYTGGTLDEYGRTGREPITPSTTRSWTLGTILGCLQTPIALSNVTGVTVIGSDGAPQTGADSQITPADLATPSDFLNTAQNPVVQSVGYTQYDRPQRNASDLDYPGRGPGEHPARDRGVRGATAQGDRLGVADDGHRRRQRRLQRRGQRQQRQRAVLQLELRRRRRVLHPGVAAGPVQHGRGLDGQRRGHRRRRRRRRRPAHRDRQPARLRRPRRRPPAPTTTGPDKSSGPTPGAPPSKQKKTGTRATARSTRTATGRRPRRPTARPPPRARRRPPRPRPPDAGGRLLRRRLIGILRVVERRIGIDLRHAARAAPPPATRRPQPPPTAQPPRRRRRRVARWCTVSSSATSSPCPPNRSPLVHLVAASTRQRAGPAGTGAPLGARRSSARHWRSSRCSALGAQRELGARWWRAPRWWRGLRLG